MTIEDIVEAFRLEAESELSCGICTFKFGWLSELVNADKKVKYPLALLLPFDSSIPSIDLTTENATIELYLFDIDHCKDGKEKACIWHQLHRMGVRLLRRLNENYCFDIQSVQVNRDSSLHNDKLVGVRYTFNLQFDNSCGLGCCGLVDLALEPVVDIATGDQILVDCDEIPETLILSFDSNKNGLLSFEIVDNNVIVKDSEDNTYSDFGDKFEFTYSNTDTKTVNITIPDIKTITRIGFDTSNVSFVGSTDLTGLTYLKDILYSEGNIVDVLLPNSVNSIILDDVIFNSVNWIDLNSNTNNFTIEANDVLGEVEMNQMLVDIDTNAVGGFTGRQILAEGNDTPTGLGLAAFSSLISKGFTVVTD